MAPGGDNEMCAAAIQGGQSYSGTSAPGGAKAGYESHRRPPKRDLWSNNTLEANPNISSTADICQILVDSAQKVLPEVGHEKRQNPWDSDAVLQSIL